MLHSALQNLKNKGETFLFLLIVLSVLVVAVLVVRHERPNWGYPPRLIYNGESYGPGEVIRQELPTEAVAIGQVQASYPETSAIPPDAPNLSTNAIEKGVLIYLLPDGNLAYRDFEHYVLMEKHRTEK